MADHEVARRPVQRSSLGRASDRISFLYIERAVVHRDQNALTFQDQERITHVPAAMVQTILLGPGTRISHAAMALLSESGTGVVWVGENGVRYYAHGRPLATNTRLLMEQARLVSTTRSRLAVAKAMYSMRFPGEDIKNLTMQQLRGREGVRVKRAYREASEQYGVAWDRRSYKFDDFADSDEINKALSAANHCLYGVVHAVIAALGASPSLGFVHTGHELSFVHDIADLYKAELTIPLAFRVAAELPMDVAAQVRYRFRDEIASRNFMDRCVKDIFALILPEGEGEDLSGRIVHWDPKLGLIEGGLDQSRFTA